MMPGCKCDPPPRLIGEPHKKGCMWFNASPKLPTGTAVSSPEVTRLGDTLRRVAVDFVASQFVAMLAENLPPGALIAAGVGGLAIQASPKDKRRAELAKLLRALAEQCEKDKT